ncbi:MAG: 6-bladed beta-propeller, partial [Nitrospirae bacterium]
KKRLYIVDFMRHAVSVYDYRGRFLFEFGGKGWSSGWFLFPRYLDVDSKGRVFVADTFNQRVQVFKPGKIK